MLLYVPGKLAVLDIGNNSISAKGAFHVAEYIKNCKSLLWINLYMNDIGDEVFIFSIVSRACKFFKFSICGLKFTRVCADYSEIVKCNYREKLLLTEYFWMEES